MGEGVPRQTRQSQPTNPWFGSVDGPRVLYLDSKVILQDSFKSAADLAAILGPEPFAPIAKATGLGTEQMKQGVAVARIAR